MHLPPGQSATSIEQSHKTPRPLLLRIWKAALGSTAVKTESFN